MIDFNEIIANSDYMSIANSALKKYTKLLSIDELNQCRYIGIWKACKNYKNKGSILSTYIYNNIKWECIRQININKKFVYKPIAELVVFDEDIFSKLSVFLEKDDFELINDRFNYRKTIKELANERKITVKKMSNKLKNILRLVKEVLT